MPPDTHYSVIHLEGLREAITNSRMAWNPPGIRTEYFQIAHGLRSLREDCIFGKQKKDRNRHWLDYIHENIDSDTM
jgi:hypothetical protein